MQRKHRRRLSPSTLIATIALIAATGGTAIAAGEIITSPDQIASGVVTEPKLANDAVSARTLANVSVGIDELKQPVVAAGVNKGVSTGKPPFLVNPTRDVVSVETAGPNFNNGRYTLTFDRPVRHCQWTATPIDIQGQGRAPAFIHVRPSTIATTKIEVFTSKLQTFGSNKGTVTQEGLSFYVMGRC
jgi:hypothetical protein